ncbi:hypothetical protein FOA52_002789 [Chlamydomonas sp. UWO 241]|nr:hypothetical protein FOA52_002789 [Chlamydomonas sp. UWO 241]
MNAGRKKPPTTGDDRPPFALIDVDLHGVPKVNTELQMFTVDMDVRLRVYIPELRKVPFVFPGCVASPDVGGGAIPEPLELHNFPLDVQRLHVTYEFELAEESLDKDVTRAAVLERLYNIHYYDVSKVAREAVATLDDEWSLHHENALDIFARPISKDKLSAKIVFVVKRRPTFYLINIALPVWCIVLFSFISFAFDAAELDVRLQVTLTMVLTLVAFKLSVSTAKYLPITSRMSLMDWFMILAFVVVALVALQNFLAFQLMYSVPWVERRDDDELFRKDGYHRVANLLVACDKGDGAIEELWSKYFASVGLAMETAATGGLDNKDAPERLCTRALAVTKKMMHPYTDHPYVLRSRSNLAGVLSSQGRPKDAELLLRQALKGWQQKALGDDDPDTLSSLNDLGHVLEILGKYEEAEPVLRAALAGREKSLGAGHRDTLTSLNNLADVLRPQRQKLEGAEAMYRRALEGRQRALGDEHSDTLQSLTNLANALRSQFKWDEAEELYRRALAGRQKTLGDEHPDTLKSLTLLAIVLQARKKMDEAEQVQRRALAGHEKVLGDNHPDTLTGLNTLANVLQSQRKLVEAAQMHQRALTGRRETLGPKNAETLFSMNNLASVFCDQGKLDQGERLHRLALAGRQETLGVEHQRTLASIDSLAAVLVRLDRLPEAEELLRQGLAGRQKSAGYENPYTLNTLGKLVDLLMSQGRVGEAEKLRQEATGPQWGKPRLGPPQA